MSSIGNCVFSPCTLQANDRLYKMWNVFPVANGKRFIVDGGRPMLWQNFPAFCFKALNVALDYEIVE